MTLLSSLAELRSDQQSNDGDLQFPSKSIDGVFCDGEPVRLAVHAQSSPVLLLPAASEDLVKRMPECGGLSISVVQYRINDGAFRYFIQLKCVKSELESAFMDLLENICDRIRAGLGAVTSLQQAVSDFRDLLRSAADAVDRKIVLGLFGELFVMREVAPHHSNILPAWTGPLGHRRDFCFSGVALEVKTSEKTDRRTVEISSLGQLTVDDVETLILWYLRVEEDPGSGTNIGELIAELEPNLGDPEELKTRLAAVGYLPTRRKLFDSYRWRVIESRPYVITEGFPRITEQDFSSGTPQGVSNISYTSDLDLAGEFEVSVEMACEAVAQ